MIRIKRFTMLGMAFVAGATGQSAGANEIFCSTLTTTSPSYYCADATTNVQTVQFPDAVSSSAARAAVAGAGVGFGGGASAAAGPGNALHAFASVFTDADPVGTELRLVDRSIAHASLFDSGLILAGTSGAAIGTPVALHFTLNVEGLFLGDGEARTDLVLFNGLNRVYETGDFVAAFAANAHTLTFDSFAFHIGDLLSLRYTLTARASAASVPQAFHQSLADASDTALLNFDILTPGAFFASASGTDYTTTAAPPPPPPPPSGTVPEPSSVLLLTTGLVAAGSLRRRARDGSGQAVALPR